MEPPWEGGKKVYINGAGHLIKMAATPISKLFSYRNYSHMIMKLGMEHYVLKLYKVFIIIYINYDPELTLTYFKTMSNLAQTCFCTYSRPRFEVSVFRTIGPLV